MRGQGGFWDIDERYVRLTDAGDRISILALSNAGLMLVGGDSMDEPRHIWWNLASSLPRP
jgi:redox-sensitive bicupin YhaK (pirin superfamily)